MTRQENRHNRPGMDLVRDEVSYGVSRFRFPHLFIRLSSSYVMKLNN